MKRIVFLIFIFCLFAQQSLAIVNMKNASYSEKWVDIIVPGSGYDFRIERFYNSRSLFIGLFGFGWCSDIETKLDILSDGRVVLTECGGGLEITYYPQKFDRKSVTRTIDEIINIHKRKNRSISQQAVKTLRTQLISDTKQRFELAKNYGLISGSEIRKKKNTYTPHGNSVEKISYDGKNYTRKLADGTLQKFNKYGQLIQSSDLKGNWIKLTYAGKRLSFIGDNNGRKLVFSYKTSGELEKIYSGQGVQSSYQFSGENLTQATSAWGKTYKYEYDQGHNLTKVLFPDRSSITMSYELRSDWIKSYKDRRGCRQTFNFQLSRDDPKNHYTSFVDKKCKGKTVETGKVEFWYKNYTKSKAKYLDRVLSILSGNYKDSRFHPIIGKPISVARQDSTERYSYYQNGLTHIKELKSYNKKREILHWESSTYKYNNSFKKVSEALKTIFASNGKKKKVVKTKFTYNRRGLLLSAKRPSTGEEIKVQYTSSGKISSLINQKKTQFKLTYGTTHDKPETIEKLNSGKVKVSYSLSGDVTKVTSSKGRTVASSVIQSFISFIDILGPAAEELII